MFQFSDKGGFGLTCLRARLSTFRFRTLQRFLDRSSHPAYNLFSHFIQQYRNLNLDIHLFLTDINAKFLNSIPNFHCEIITAWLLSNARISVPLTSIYHILNLPLNCTHLNQNTKERLPSPRLLACGITLVGHLINFSTGKWKSAEDLHPPQHRHLLRTSSRALQMDFNIMQSNLANNFPYFFNRQGCWRLPKNLKDIPPFPAPFSEITIPPNINGLTSTSKCLYDFFNRTINSLSEKSMKTPWHENGVTRPTTSAQWKATYHQPISKKKAMSNSVSFIISYHPFQSYTTSTRNSTGTAAGVGREAHAYTYSSFAQEFSQPYLHSTNFYGESSHRPTGTLIYTGV